MQANEGGMAMRKIEFWDYDFDKCRELQRERLRTMPDVPALKVYDALVKHDVNCSDCFDIMRELGRDCDGGEDEGQFVRLARVDDGGLIDPGVCDGCSQPFGLSLGKVRAGPVLEDRIWLRIVDRPQDIMCDRCVRSRIEQALGRPLSFGDLKVCPFNAGAGYLEEFAPPGLFSDP